MSTKILRKLHFFASLTLFMFALMYVMTGIVMSKYEWFPHAGDIKTEKSYPLAFTPDTTNLKALGRDLKDYLNISGRMNYQKNKKGDIIYTIQRPGEVHKVTLKSDLENLHVEKTENSTIGLISTRIHRIYGYHGGLLYVVWAILLDLTAISVIIFALTGIILWFRFRRYYKLGWFVLVPGFVLAMVMFIFLW